MEKLTFFVLLIIFFYVSGLIEGNWKSKKTANHWYPIIQTLSLMVMMYLLSIWIIFETNIIYNILSVPFLRKFPFDTAYNRRANAQTQLGTTSWDDIIITKISTFLKKIFGNNFPYEFFLCFMIFVFGMVLFFI